MSWLKEFGAEYEIPAEVLKLITDGLAQDLSWHNDVCPSFGCLDEHGEDKLRIFVEHPEPAQRETEGSPRFGVCTWTNGTNQQCVHEGDDVMQAVAAYRRFYARRNHPARCDCRACRPELYV